MRIYMENCFSDRIILNDTNRYIEFRVKCDTLAEGTIDFKFKNNRDYPVLLSAQVEKNTLKTGVIGKKDNNNETVRIVSKILNVYYPKGEEIIITRRGKRIARISNLDDKPSPLKSLKQFRKMISVKGKPLSQAVIEQRNEERY